MDYQAFPAKLSAGYNNICEYGNASVAPEGNAIDFTGDFIPLIPLGTEATIEWMLGDKIVVGYFGKVYLSSQNLLRLVEVDPERIRQTRALFASNVQLPASIVPKKSGPWLKTGASSHPATIVYLSQKVLHLRCPQPLKAGQALCLDAEVDFLTLYELPLLVKHCVMMRRADALLLCAVQPTGNDNVVALSAYSAKLEHLEDTERQ